MRGWIALGALALTGCHAVFGVDVDVEAQVCAAAEGPTDDPDSDGIINADDNCPTVANVDQSNEDRDCLGDACDLCPWLRMPGDGDAETNVDGDRFGPGCDPDEGRPLTTVFFDNFVDRLPTQMRFPGDSSLGPWPVADGKYLQPGTYGWATWGTSVDPADLDTRFTLDPETLAAGGDFLIGVHTLISTTNPSTSSVGLIAGVARDPDGLWLRFANVNIGTFSKINQTLLADPDTLEPVSLDGSIRLHVYASAQTCTATVWIDGQKFEVSVQPSFPVSGGYHGLFSLSMPAAFEYFAVLR